MLGSFSEKNTNQNEHESQKLQQLEHSFADYSNYDSAKALQAEVDFINSRQASAQGISAKEVFNSLASADVASKQATLLGLSQDGSLNDLDALNLLMRQDSKLMDPEHQQGFLSNVNQFEQRGQLSSTEKEHTLIPLARLLENSHATRETSTHNRSLAAASFATHLADPTTIRQGGHDTCNVTSLEHRMMYKAPAEEAEMLSQALLTGTYLSKDGKLIDTMPSSYTQPGPEESQLPTEDGERSYATQILNVVTLNDIAQHLDENLKYEEDLDGNKTEEWWVKPDGQKLSFADTKGGGVFDRTGGTTDWEVGEENARLTGQKDGVIDAKQWQYTDIPKADEPADGSKTGDIFYVGSPQELENHLADIKRKGQFPVEIGLDADRLVQGILGGKLKQEGDPAPDHDVTVDDYVPAKNGQPAKAYIHNQWPAKYDGWISVEDLYHATT